MKFQKKKLLLLNPMTSLIKHACIFFQVFLLISKGDITPHQIAFLAQCMLQFASMGKLLEQQLTFLLTCLLTSLLTFSYFH